MRILLITQWFDPEPTFKGLAFARALRDAGHEVEVITGFPNYPGGRLYSGYRMRWLQRERHEGMSINRVPLYPSHGNSALGRVLNYLSFAASSFLFGVFGARRPDVIYCYHPPLTTVLSGLAIGFLRRAPVVSDIQDLWPDTLRATGMVRVTALLGVVGYICRLSYRRASALVVLSPGFKRELVARGVPAEKIHVIYNWCDEDAISSGSNQARKPVVMEGRFNVVFAGTMGKAQALGAVLEAAERVAPLNPLVQFVFVGGGIEVDRLKAHVVERNLHNVVFLARLPMSEVGIVLRTADGLLVHLKDDPLFAITVPSKTQAYMAAGRPIIMAVRGDAADLVERSGAGLVAEPEQPESIAQAVLELAAMSTAEREAMGQRAARFYADNMALCMGAGHFERVFARVARS